MAPRELKWIDQSHSRRGASLSGSAGRSSAKMWTSNGRLEDLLDFELSHRFVHRADMAQQSRMKQLGEVLGIYLTNADEEWAAAVAAFVAQSALHGYKAAASIFGWTAPAPEEADTLLEELAALASAE